ncbi:exported hypothetical protein [Candidatus Sulfopaludibacter sp. SbA3]|nr:exported hypothetical protein [Candidatus Sulfopaludibacter sp. SbA3]
MERAIVIFAAICAVTLLPARAGTVFSISPATIPASPGDAGDSVDVVLTNNGPGPISVAAFAFEVTVADPNVTLVGANYATAFPYIFAGDSFDQINAALLESLCSCSYTLSGPNVDTTNQTLVASDLTNDGAGFTIASGGSFGLGHVLFDVAPGAAPGQFMLSFTGNFSGVVADSNSLSDPSGNPISVANFYGGTISVSSVPEPSPLSLALAGIAALMVAVFLSKRHRRTS